jgi:hypothetical protein
MGTGSRLQDGRCECDKNLVRAPEQRHIHDAFEQAVCVASEEEMIAPVRLLSTEDPAARSSEEVDSLLDVDSSELETTE